MQIASPIRLRQGGTIAALAASLMLGACGQSLKPSGGLLSVINNDQTAALSQKAPPPAAQAQAPASSGGVSTELLKATDYWGQAYAKHPRDLQAALNYARNLKAMGEKPRALAVLQQASLYHGQDRELASEYGRIALDLGQVSAAKQLLAVADDPAKPDWRVISARGAALAKEGKYDEAIPFFERARVLSQDQPSVMSNLALAYAMNGDAGKAETMLRQAVATDDSSPRIRQNLALVLGLRGKYDEAKLVASRDMPMNNASENADYLRQVVQLDPKSVPNSEPAPWNTESKMIAQSPTVDAVPVEKVARMSASPVADPAATDDRGWVVSEPATQAANTAVAASNQPKILSVSEMAAQFAVADDEATVAPKKTSDHKNSVVAQFKR